MEADEWVCRRVHQWSRSVSCLAFASIIIVIYQYIGTGGTIAGIGVYLKSLNADVKIVLADPEGSGLFNKIKYGVMFDEKEREGTKRRHQVGIAACNRECDSDLFRAG